MRLLSAEVASMYQRVRLLSFVDYNSSICWCPATDCQEAVALNTRAGGGGTGSDGGVREGAAAGGKPVGVVCRKGHNFCFACRGDSHAPISCAEHRAWDRKVQEKQGVDGKMTKLDDVKVSA